MKQLDCTAKELSDRSGISTSVISRYRSGEREPQPDSNTLATLASVLAAIASEKDNGACLCLKGIFQFSFPVFNQNVLL